MALRSISGPANPLIQLRHGTVGSAFGGGNYETETVEKLNLSSSGISFRHRAIVYWLLNASFQNQSSADGLFQYHEVKELRLSGNMFGQEKRIDQILALECCFTFLIPAILASFFFIV